MTRFINWWMTPEFPQKHIAKILAYNPDGLKNKIRNYFRTWFIHPIKRRIARGYLWFLRLFFGLKVIGITGSSGKTTTKEMLASILKRKEETVYSYANIDPVYNIPTTILRCRPSTKYLILEMGVEYPGEMDFYLWLAKPDVAIITNIYPTHTLFFGNIEGVYKEKSKLVKRLSDSDYAVLNSTNIFLWKLRGKLKAKIVWFGIKSQIYSSNIRITKDFKTRFTLSIANIKAEINLSVLGKQFVDNALAAASSAFALGIRSEIIKRGLETYQNQEHRMNIRRLKFGAIIIDDSYNNNPEAAKKAIELLKSVAGKRKTVLVFGDMLELGNAEVKYHKEINRFIGYQKIDYIVGVGPLSKYLVRNEKYWAEDWKNAVPIVRHLIGRKMVILVKGSRSMGLDNLVSRLI